ncbi:MAG: gamma-glutamylcyclotransferase [Rhodospirillaceae bacterium]|nr:MAG: gamma-glutamylcyclotransferase [Rhodospirillaceae bacterium]
MLYFAYGSNLDRRAMARRCPQAEPVAPARLDGYRLVFRGFADIVKDPAGIVWGALYRLTPSCIRALDKYEDAPRTYRKIKVTVICDEVPCEASAYAMNKGPISPPDVVYYGEIARGYADWKLDQALLRRARLSVLGSQRDYGISFAAPAAGPPVSKGPGDDAPIRRRR